MFKFNLLENEKVMAIYRQTEVVLFKSILIIFALIYFPFYFLLKYEMFADFSKFLFAWSLIVLLYGTNKYLTWLLNVYLLTDQRLILFRHKNLLHKQVLETPLSNVLSVSFSVNGFWQSLFKYGSVEVRIRGLHEPLLLKNVARPSRVKDYIWKVLNIQNPVKHLI